MFFVTYVQRVFQRMKDSGVVFTRDPTQLGTVTAAVFDDIRDKLIRLTQT